MNNKILKQAWAFIMLMGLLFTACEDNNTEIEEETDYITVVEGVSNSGDYTLKVLAEDSLFEGYNKLFISVEETSTGDMVNDASIKFHPLMDMMTKVHAAPFENPVQNEAGDMYEGAVVFIMPSTDDMGWSMKISLDDAGNKDTVAFDLPMVRNLDEVRKIMAMSAIDGTVYIVSRLSPLDPEVGINDIEFTVHKKESMMSFPAVEDLTLEIEPEMPSMDHGSPNNEHPTHMGNGHYKGKVNFTMTGWWRVHLSLKLGSDTIKNDAYFDITFQ